MMYRFRIGNYRISFTFALVTDVVGVNGNLDGNDHILMWDFDKTTLNDVVESLLTVQLVYELPKIYILESKKDTNFMAYCFKRTPWRKVVEIIAFTKGVDWNYLRVGIYRNHFTLRVTPKSGRKPKLIWTLKSNVPEDCNIFELMSWVEYETLADKRL